MKHKNSKQAQFPLQNNLVQHILNNHEYIHLF